MSSVARAALSIKPYRMGALRALQMHGLAEPVRLS